MTDQPKLSPAMQEFLDTWGRYCGAPLSVFQGHLQVLLNAEISRENAQLAEDKRRLRSALERLAYSYRLLAGGKPVRDMAETLGEVEAALGIKV